MMNTVAELIVDVAAEIHESAKWWGAEMRASPTAYTVLASSPRLSADDCREALDFYNGHQWDDAILRLRQEQGRPCLVVNRLPELVAAAIDAQRAADLPPLDEDAYQQLVAILTRHNQDAQRIYNYTLSMLTELLSIQAI